MSTKISIDEAKAQQWILDVQNELRLVETVLSKVAEAQQTIPESNDEIMKSIVATFETLNKKWTDMCSGFNEATGIIGNVIQKIGTAAEDVLSDINGVRSNIS